MGKTEFIQARRNNIRDFTYSCRRHAAVRYSDTTYHWHAYSPRRKVSDAASQLPQHPYIARVTPLVLEAFIVRLFREKNKKGFVKAFTDQPEHITSGLSPLKNIMKELQLRNVHIYPRSALPLPFFVTTTKNPSRFHEDIKQTLERRQADVIELSQPLTEPMADIHHAIIQCMSTTLSELKRSNTTVCSRLTLFGVSAYCLSSTSTSSTSKMLTSGLLKLLFDDSSIRYGTKSAQRPNSWSMT